MQLRLKDMLKVYLPVLLFLLNLLNFYSYKLFIGLYFATFLLFYKNKLTNFESFLVKLIPFTFYLSQLLNVFLEKPRNSSIFWDMQDFLHFIKCNVKPEHIHSYRYISEERICVDTIGYGFITKYIIFNGDIWATTLIIFAIFSTLVLIFLFNLKNNVFLVVTLLISPSFNFLIFSLNTDLFIFTYFVYLFCKDIKSWSFIDLLLLSLFSQLKLYPLLLICGYVFFIMLKDKKLTKKLYLSIAVLIINTFSIIYFLFFLDPFLPNPLSYTRTFGFLHDINLMREVVGYDEVIKIIFSLLIFVAIFILIGKTEKIFKLVIVNFESKYLDKFVIFFPLTLVINLFHNWGYKFIFNFFVIYLIFKFCKPVLMQLFLIILILTNTTYYLIGYGFLASFENFTYLIISKLSFYIFLTIGSVNFYFSVKKLVKSIL